MAARHPARQTGILCHHGWRWRPGWIDALVGHGRGAFPAILLAWNGDRITDGLTGSCDEIKPSVAETHDDVARRKARVEAYDRSAAGSDFIAAAPVPEQL